MSNVIYVIWFYLNSISIWVWTRWQTHRQNCKICKVQMGWLKNLRAHHVTLMRVKCFGLNIELGLIFLFGVPTRFRVTGSRLNLLTVKKYWKYWRSSLSKEGEKVSKFIQVQLQELQGSPQERIIRLIVAAGYKSSGVSASGMRHPRTEPASELPSRTEQRVYVVIQRKRRWEYISHFYLVECDFFFLCSFEIHVFYFSHYFQNQNLYKSFF